MPAATFVASADIASSLHAPVVLTTKTGLVGAGGGNKPPSFQEFCTSSLGGAVVSCDVMYERQGYHNIGILWRVCVFDLALKSYGLVLYPGTTDLRCECTCASGKLEVLT